MNRRTYVAHLEDEPHAVYVIWRNDVALYVGMTSNWEARTKAHEGFFTGPLAATHIDAWEACATRAEAEELERQTIRDLDPSQNAQHSPRRERMAEDWRWYSEWVAALGRGFDAEFAWAKRSEAHERALRVLQDHGWSKSEAIEYGLYPGRARRAS